MSDMYFQRVLLLLLETIKDLKLSAVVCLLPKITEHFLQEKLLDLILKTVRNNESCNTELQQQLKESLKGFVETTNPLVLQVRHFFF
jgi:hypothetical protein